VIVTESFASPAGPTPRKIVAVHVVAELALLAITVTWRNSALPTPLPPPSKRVRVKPPPRSTPLLHVADDDV
jgi:hypothetical protein